jgi:hypothetical protein
MLERGAIKHALNECQLSREQNELWDGEPDMYINQGWIEALEYVLTIGESQRYFVKVNFDTIKEKLYEKSRKT